MPSDNPTVKAFYQGWETYQNTLLKAIAPLTQDQLNLYAAPDLRAVNQILKHIIAVRVRWFHQAAGAETDDETKAMATWDRPNAPNRTTAELVKGLETSWRFLQGALDKWSASELEQPFEVDYGDEKETLTRQWIIWHVIEHDLHHGGEISYSLGMHGIPGIDL